MSSSTWNGDVVATAAPGAAITVDDTSDDLLAVGVSGPWWESVVRVDGGTPTIPMSRSSSNGDVEATAAQGATITIDDSSDDLPAVGASGLGKESVVNVGRGTPAVLMSGSNSNDNIERTATAGSGKP